MINHEDSSKIVRVTLSPREGDRLFVFLYEQVDSGAEQARFVDLEELIEKLDHANALAVWLREDVKLELEAHEIISILQTLENLSSAESFSSASNNPLLDVQDKLAECLPEARFAAKIN